MMKGLKNLNDASNMDASIKFMVLITSSLYEQEREIIENLKDVQCPRIFGVSLGECANPYFLKYLAAISRGKSKHLNHEHTVYDEIISFFNEFQSPICMDLSLNIAYTNENIEFDAERMCHPYPIGDVYGGYPLLIKLDL